jgi:hypothetical protein
MLALGVFGGRYMTDCRANSRQLVSRTQSSAPLTTTEAELLRRQRLAVAGDVVAQWLDPSAGSARLVPVVLPLLHGTALV